MINLEARKSIKKTLISVDIQPEYYHKSVKVGGFNDNILNGLISALNSNAYNKKVILYNGADTIGMISLADYQMWLLDNGLEEDKLNECLFYDKGYAFFRFVMDSGIDEDDIVLLVKFMQANNITDSRDITESGLWDKFMQEYDKLELRELLEDAADCINIPDLMDWLNSHVKGDTIELIGGGQNECLKECEIALKSLGINYSKNDNLVYEGQEDLFNKVEAPPVMSLNEKILRYFKEARMYHGSSSDFDKPKDGIIYWVTPSSDFALEYANGSVVHRKNGSNPILYIHNVDVKQPALVTDDHSPIMRLLVKWWENAPLKDSVNKEELKYIRDRIVDVWHNIGLDNSNTAVYNHWNMTGVAGNNLLMDYLQLLGYDSIHYKEGNVDTYGLFRVDQGTKINMGHLGS